MIKYNPEKVVLDYGRTGLELKLDKSIADWVVIEPEDISPSKKFDELFDESVENPIQSQALRQVVSPDDKIIIVTSDGTRPIPNRLLIPAIIKKCRLVPENVTVLIGTGSHRPPSRDELVQLLGRQTIETCRVISHDARDTQALEFIGTTAGGIPVNINRSYIKADKRIVIGFIEPHFFAGFSGGPKGICPAIVGLDTIDAFHSFRIIGHPDSDYGILHGNPQYLAACDVVSFMPPDFLINVILNVRKEIVSIYSGNYIEAHRQGAQEAAKISMVPIGRKFNIVVTTNSGYPLDQNLYQTVKGIWTATRIVEEGGAIALVSECSKGIPDDGNFARLMSACSTPEELLVMLSDKTNHTMDRWQAQKLAMALKKAKVYVYTSLDEQQVGQCKLIKTDNLTATLSRLTADFREKPTIAVLPRGPITIPID